MAGLVVAMVVVARHDQDAGIGERLRFERARHRPPAGGGAVAGEPFVLRVGEQDLAVLRRAQDVDPEFLGEGGDESAAMGVLARHALGRPSGRPVSQSICAPAIHLLSTPMESSACASFCPFAEIVVTSAAKPSAGAASSAAAKVIKRRSEIMAFP